MKIGGHIGPFISLRIGERAGATEAESSTTLTLSLADSADPVPGNDSYTYTATVTNTDLSQAASEVTAIITLDPALTYVSAAGTGWACAQSSGVITCTRASLAANTASDIVVTVTPAANADATVTVTAHVNADNTPAVADESEDTDVIGWTDISIAIADEDDPHAGDTDMDYTVTVSNDGDLAATDLEAVIELDPSLTFVSAVGTGWTCDEDAGTVTCTRATLAANTAAPDITITVTPTNADATITTTADCTATNADAAAQDSEDTEIQEVVVGCSLTVAISDSADPVMTSAAFSYSVVVTVADEDADNLECVITLDPQLTYVSSSGTGWSTGESGGVVTCTRATGSVGVQPTITVNVTSAAAAETSSTTADADADNATAPATQDTETTVTKLVTKDATSGIRCPATTTEWADLLTCIGLSGTVAVDSAWKCDEASGNLADIFGSLTLTATNTPLYAQSATGWTRTGVSATDGTTGQFAAAATVGPNPTLTSQTWVGFFAMPATPSAARTVMGINLSSTTVEHRMQQLNTSGFPRLRHVATSTDGSTSVSSRVDLMAVKYDRTNSEAKGYTKSEKLTATYSALVADGPKGFIRGSAAVCVYGFMMSSTNGEITDANLKSLLQGMGWVISWT